VGIDPSLLTGARYVLNIKVPPIPANVAPTVLGGDYEYEESDEKWQYIEVQVSGSHFSELALLLIIIITRVYVLPSIEAMVSLLTLHSRKHTHTYMTHICTDCLFRFVLLPDSTSEGFATQEHTRGPD
jgi:hypothetical protein